MPKRFGLCCALLALSTSALAQSRGPAARLPPQQLSARGQHRQRPRAEFVLAAAAAAPQPLSAPGQRRQRPRPHLALPAAAAAPQPLSAQVRAPQRPLAELAKETVTPAMAPEAPAPGARRALRSAAPARARSPAAPRGNSITGNLGQGWWRRERVPALCCFAAPSRTASSPARRSSSTAAAARCPMRSADRSSIMTSASCLPGKRRWSEQSAASRDTSRKSWNSDCRTPTRRQEPWRSRQYLILAAMAWTLLLSGVAIVLLFAKLRRSQSPPKTENPKTEDASAAAMTRSSVYSRFSESIAQADAASAAKSHGYQSGGRVRVFFQTRASNPSGNSSALGRVGYAPR
jgi:hypothetical protein